MCACGSDISHLIVRMSTLLPSSVRCETAHELACDGGMRAVTTLLTSLHDDPDPSVRAEIAGCLSSISQPRVANALRNALADSNDDVQSRAAEALRSLKIDLAVPALTSGLDSSVPGRWYALLALEKIPSPTADTPLLICLKDSDPEIRGRAASALGRRGVTKAIDALRITARDPAWIVRMQALWSLGVMKAVSARSMVETALGDPNITVRGIAAFALARMGDGRAVDALIPALRDEHPLVRQEVARALATLTGRNFGEDAIAWRQWREQRLQSTESKPPPQIAL